MDRNRRLLGLAVAGAAAALFVAGVPATRCRQRQFGQGALLWCQLMQGASGVQDLHELLQGP